MPVDTISSALLAGCAYGFLISVSPDHLGTLMTLSALATGAAAFRIGALWGLGHAIGALLVLAVVCIVRWASHVEVKEKIELYGDYFVGVSLMCCGLYFMCRESTYIVQNEDGTYEARACDCCFPMNGTSSSAANSGYGGADVETTPSGGKSGKKGQSLNLRADYRRPSSPPSEERPLMTAGSPWTWRDVNAAMLGLLQGFCCPMSLVGMGMISGVSAGVRTAAFMIACALTSIFFTAVFAMAWARITTLGWASLQPRLVFRATCTFTFLLGLVWVTFTYFGMLHFLDYSHWDSTTNLAGANAEGEHHHH